ncbi:hypothetical protein BaRGS_00028519, partial [Batillaria attramentaria]
MATGTCRGSLQRLQELPDSSYCKQIVEGGKHPNRCQLGVLYQELTQLTPRADSADTSGRGFGWAVLLLLEKYREYKWMLLDPRMKKMECFKKISTEMRAMGHQFSPDQCCKKFDNMKSRHKIIRDRNGKTGRGRSSWVYFDLMEDLMSGIPRFNLLTLYRQKKGRAKRIPLCKDVAALSEFLSKKSVEAIGSLETDNVEGNHDVIVKKAWNNLAEVTLTQLILSNRRRQGEVSKLKPSDLTNPGSQDSGGEGSNCLEDSGKWLLSLSTTSSSLATEQVPQADRHATLAVDMDKSVCSACKGSLVGTRTGSSTETFLNTKQYRGIHGGLKMPSPILQRSVKQMEREYEDVVGTLLHTDQVMWRVVCKLSKKNEVVCIEGNRCNVGHLVVQLFASLRLHFTLKDSNRHLEESSTFEEAGSPGEGGKTDGDARRSGEGFQESQSSHGDSEVATGSGKGLPRVQTTGGRVGLCRGETDSHPESEVEEAPPVKLHRKSTSKWPKMPPVDAEQTSGSEDGKAVRRPPAGSPGIWLPKYGVSGDRPGWGHAREEAKLDKVCSDSPGPAVRVVAHSTSGVVGPEFVTGDRTQQLYCRRVYSLEVRGATGGRVFCDYWDAVFVGVYIRRRL